MLIGRELEIPAHFEGCPPMSPHPLRSTLHSLPPRQPPTTPAGLTGASVRRKWSSALGSGEQAVLKVWAVPELREGMK